MRKGKVKWFNLERGYGFIAGEDGSDCFIHVSGISDKSDTLNLLPDMEVEYEVVESEKGPRATELTVVSQ